jgi:hypothetical protein
MLLIHRRKDVRTRIGVEKVPNVDGIGTNGPRQLRAVVRPQTHLKIPRGRLVEEEIRQRNAPLVLENVIIGIVAVIVSMIRRHCRRKVQMAGRVVASVDPIFQGLLVAPHGFRQQTADMLQAGEVVFPEFTKVFGHGD